jgi:hypothetical protein
MAVRARAIQARLLPHGPLDLVRQVLLFFVAYNGYRLVRGMADDPGVTASAFQHARELIGIERSLHVFVEPSVQAWTSGSSFLIDTTSWLYINAQTSVTVGALAFLYLFHNRSFYFVRNMFMVAMGIALIGYMVYPTAPPRFLPEWGFFDAVSNFTGVGHDDVTVNAIFNPYAAVPSMHVCFAFMIGWPLAKLVKHRVARIFWLFYPLLVTFVIVATANHFIADAFLGGCTAAVAAVAARALARARPTVWAFSRVPGDSVPV